MTIYDEDYTEKRAGKDRRATMTQEEITALIEDVAIRTSRTQCGEHSGMVAWVKVGCGLLSILLVVFSWSTFVVAPEVKTSLDKQTAINDKRFYALERDVTDLKLNDLRIISQRNLDHATKEKLQ